MTRTLWKERIASDPAMHHGAPCVKGTRVPVSVIVGSLADGLRPEEIVAQYPQLTLLDIRAALDYAAEVLHQDQLLSLDR